MASILDEKDKKIIEVLKDNADYSTRQIAKKILLPTTTIHNRIQKLKKEGIIKRFTVKLDPKKMGKHFTVMILGSVDYKTLRQKNLDEHQMGRKIYANPEVESFYILTGDNDFMIKARFKDVEEYETFLVEKIRSIEGIDKIRTSVISYEI